MNGILWLFVFLTANVALAWGNKYRLSIILFILFLIIAFFLFVSDITDPLTIQL